MVAYRAECPGCGQGYRAGERGGHCMSCHRTFAGDQAAAHHRTGPYNPPGLRRCLTDAEMAGRGFRRTARGWTDSEPLPDGFWRDRAAAGG